MCEGRARPREREARRERSGRKAAKHCSPFRAEDVERPLRQHFRACRRPLASTFEHRGERKVAGKALTQGRRSWRFPALRLLERLVRMIETGAKTHQRLGGTRAPELRSLRSRLRCFE